MGASDWFVRKIGHPLWLLYKGQAGIQQYRRQLERLFAASQEELDEWRNSRLRKLLDHAAVTSRYYRELFAEHAFNPQAVGNATQLQRLPFITKEILNQRLEDILSTAFKRNELTESSTGGSSGIPLTFFRNESATQVRRAQDYFFNSMIGIYPGTKRAWVWGSSIDAFSLGKLKARIANFLTERAIYFYSFDATHSRIVEFIQRLRQHQPEVIFAYPNMLAEIARTVIELSIKPLRIPKIVVTAEPLYDWQRQLFGEVFGAETYERYGSREIGTVAAEISPAGGMCVCEPSYVLEVIDSNGSPVPMGEMGELVVTDLFNYAMPLIRYRTGDMVRLGLPSPGSRSNWRQIVEVGGRVVDMIQRVDGSTVSGEALIMALRSAGVRTKVQVVQETPVRLRVLHLREDTFPPDLLNNFITKAGEILRGQVEVVLEPVMELPYDRSGKYRYVTSRCHRAGYVRNNIAEDIKDR